MSLADMDIGEEIIDPLQKAEDDWFEARRGKLTGSNFKKVIGTGRGKGDEFTREGLEYLRVKVAERLGSWHSTSMSASSLQWGKDNEALAIKTYQERTGFNVDSAPFRLVDYSDDIASTPDGLVNCDSGVNAGCLEVKCPWNPANHIETLTTKKVPKIYAWQVAGHCLVTGRYWCDFVSFDPRMSGREQMVIVRWKWDSQLIQFLEERLNTAVEWINQQVAIIKAGAP